MKTKLGFIKEYTRFFNGAKQKDTLILKYHKNYMSSVKFITPKRFALTFLPI